MTPPPPPPEPPTQSSHSEAKKAEDPQSGPGGPRKFFRNLLFLANATEAEIASQAQRRVQESIEAINLEKTLKEKLETKTKEINDNISTEKEKKMREIQKTGSYAKFSIWRHRNKIKRNLDKLGQKLRSRINGLIYLLALLGFIIVPLVPRITQDFSLIKTLETQIKYLESDIEDLQDDRDTS